MQGAFNVAIAPPDMPLPGYERGECNGRGTHRYCLFKRAGSCSAIPEIAPYEVQRYRRDRGL